MINCPICDYQNHESNFECTRCHEPLIQESESELVLMVTREHKPEHKLEHKPEHKLEPEPEHKLEPEPKLECIVCRRSMDQIYGLVHGESAHQGYCEGCAEMILYNQLPCPICRAQVTKLLRIY